ncbi:MAG: hypothetical protein AAGF11_53185 [Myxococcota bacterium]
MRRVLRSLPLTLLLGALGCPTPDSVELGGACKQQVECKEPADTCMTLGAESLCSMACSATAPCPEGYACARMDIQVAGADGAGKADAQGYCLTKSRLGPHVATIKPKGGDKSKKKGKRGKRGKQGKQGKRGKQGKQAEPNKSGDAP